METSAKTGLNAQEIFVEAAKLLYKDFTKFKKVKAKKQGEELKAEDNARAERIIEILDACSLLKLTLAPY